MCCQHDFEYIPQTFFRLTWKFYYSSSILFLLLGTQFVLTAWKSFFEWEKALLRTFMFYFPIILLTLPLFFTIHQIKQANDKKITYFSSSKAYGTTCWNETVGPNRWYLIQELRFNCNQGLGVVRFFDGTADAAPEKIGRTGRNW